MELCWLHGFRLMTTTFAAVLLGATNRRYVRRARRVFKAANGCGRCNRKTYGT